MDSAGLHVGVVFGGKSAEAEVSKSTANAIAGALQRASISVSLLELRQEILADLRRQKVTVVYPALHGSPGEDGTFQGMLEIAGIPYVGSGVLASACAMNKPIAKDIFRRAGLPVAPGTSVSGDEDLDSTCRRVLADLGNDVVIKPIGQGSAIGVGFANDSASLQKCLETAFQYGASALIEKRVFGKEITVAVLDDGGVRAFPVVEVRLPPTRWYDYRHRYTPGLSEHIVPAEIPAAQEKRCQEIAVGAHIALGCRDFSRADFVVPASGDPVILEVNTLPGMTPTSLYPDAAKAGGYSFEQLVALLVRRAHARGA